MDDAPDMPQQAKEPGPWFTFAAVCLCIGLLAIALPNRPGPRTSPKNTCINNLRLIDGAKQTWALEHQKTNSDLPTWADIQVYFRRGTNEEMILKCPEGGKYTLGVLSNPPTCSIPGHVLP
jgi:hypothetical protein